MKTATAQRPAACKDPDGHREDWLRTENGTICTACGAPAELASPNGEVDPALETLGPGCVSHRGDPTNCDYCRDEARKAREGAEATSQAIKSPAAEPEDEGKSGPTLDIIDNGPYVERDSPSAPSHALNLARVDLVAAIRDGIPEREFIPGADLLLLRGKRYLFPAKAGIGKSLGLLVISVDVVAAGGTVAILDVENGTEEYARRLDDVLKARGSEDGLEAACEARLRYYAYPALQRDWAAEEWAAALEGVDLVVFDSSRMMLTAVGLAEDSNDDYATFANALLAPLSRAGITTAVLDNTGHDTKAERARGASAKADLNEVVYSLGVGEEFDRGQAGCLHFTRTRTRFPELPGSVRLPLGGGTYGPLEEAKTELASDSDAFRPTWLMEQISKAIEHDPGLSTNEATGAVKGKNDAKRIALRVLIAEKYVRVESKGQARLHYSIGPYREADDDDANGGQDD